MQCSIQGLHLDADFGNLLAFQTESVAERRRHLTQFRGNRAILGVNHQRTQLEIGNPAGPRQRCWNGFIEQTLKFLQMPGMGSKTRHRLIGIQAIVESACLHGITKERNDVHIILVSAQLATARSINLGWRHLAFAVACFLALVIATASLFSYITVRHAAEIRLPFLQDLLSAMNAAETQRSQEFVRENLNAMAVKLGQMQARLVRLDSLGERLSTLSGVKPAEQRETVDALKDGRGGPLIQPTPMSTADLQTMLDTLSRQIDARGDSLSMIESQLFDERLRKNMLPTTLPVATPWVSSFGWRIDPITGERAMHEGDDFPADVGTPVIAAAAGVVVSAETHPEYGNLLEIDHGNGLSTRYAHLSKFLVKPGNVVMRGQPVGLVGNTGRSTGPHLHFEVRLNGVAQNPGRFLAQASAGSAKFALATHP